MNDTYGWFEETVTILTDEKEIEKLLQYTSHHDIVTAYMAVNGVDVIYRSPLTGRLFQFNDKGAEVRR